MRDRSLAHAPDGTLSGSSVVRGTREEPTTWHSSSGCSSVGRSPRPRWSTSGSRRRSRSRSSPPTPSRRRRTRPRRSSSSSRSAASSLALGLDTLVPIAIVVAVLLAIVVTSYRQTIFAYPSGGGSYVVSRENLGENPSLVAGASLLVDYILTVAVSISAGVAAIVSIPAFHGLADHRVAARPRADRAHHARQPARHQGVGPHLRGPDLHLHRRCSPRSIVLRPRPQLVFGDIAPVPFDPEAFDGDASDRRHARPLPAAEGLLVGRGRAHRRRGDLERRARVPPARVEERRDHARVDGRHPRHAVLRRLDPRPPPRPVPEPRRRR